MGDKVKIGIISYGVNVYIEEEQSFVRYNTYKTLDAAQQVFNILTAPGIETNFWTEVEIEEIIEEQGEFKYTVLKSTMDPMLKKEYWLNLKEFFDDIIYDIDIDADRDIDGTIQNICWLKLGWVSPDSDCGFFYYSSLEEFNKLLLKVKRIKDCPVNIITKYFSWLEDNTLLLDNSRVHTPELIIKQLAEMLRN